MLWPFNQFRKSPVSRGTIGSIYGAIVAQARTPGFYADFGVPDTINGRLDMVILHLWLTLRRLRAIGETEKMGQALIDHFCSDMDDNLRELGTSDLKVPKRLLEFNEAFYGRARAYDEALAEGGAELLARALDRNIYIGQGARAAPALAAYVLGAISNLDTIDATALRRGESKLSGPVQGRSCVMSRKDKTENGKPARDQKTAREDGRTPRGFVRPEKIVPDPWRVPIAVEQIPETGVERSIVADADQLAAMADVGRLRAVYAARADLTLQPTRDSHIQVTGRVTAKIGQVCVVSLDDIDSTIDEEIDIVFAPPSKIPPMASTIDDSVDDETEIADPPEPIEDGVIDIGRIATDALFLAVDPYPRKPGAVLDLPVVDPDPEEHPFAALKALKGDRKD